MAARHPSELHQMFVEAVNNADAEALVALYEPTGLAVHLDGSELSGEAALRHMFEGLLTGIRKIEGTTRKCFIAGDIALTSAVWHANPGEPDEMKGTTAEIARRQADGTWRVVIDDPMFIPTKGE